MADNEEMNPAIKSVQDAFKIGHKKTAFADVPDDTSHPSYMGKSSDSDVDAEMSKIKPRAPEASGGQKAPEDQDIFDIGSR